MRIALIEDNEALAKGIAYQLRDAGHAVDLISDGIAADTFLSQEGADLIVLDINLPGMDGLTILQRIRGRGDATPVILLTARSDTGDRVKGLDAGADDYLVKPFEMAELEARVRALSRRRPAVATTRVRLGSLEFDTQSRQLFDAGQSLDIPRREIAVLECLLEKRGRLVPKASILDRVYGIGSEVDETVIEVHISRLRKRLEVHGLAIKNARGLGYMLEDQQR